MGTQRSLIRKERPCRLRDPALTQMHVLSRSVCPPPVIGASCPSGRLAPTAADDRRQHPKPRQTQGRGSEGLGWGRAHICHDFLVPGGNGKTLQLPPHSHSGLQQYYHSPALLLIIHFASRKRALNYMSQLPNLGHRPTEQGLREIR